MIIAAFSIINAITAGIGMLQKLFGTKSPSPVILSLPTTRHPSVFPPSLLIIEDTTKIEYENSQQKKESLRDDKSNDHTYSSNPGSSVGVILVIALVLAVIAFIIYRKRTKFKQNRFSFRQTESQFEASPSPPTSQTELSSSSLPIQQQTLTII